MKKIETLNYKTEPKDIINFNSKKLIEAIKFFALEPLESTLKPFCRDFCSKDFEIVEKQLAENIFFIPVNKKEFNKFSIENKLIFLFNIAKIQGYTQNGVLFIHFVKENQFYNK